MDFAQLEKMVAALEAPAQVETAVETSVDTTAKQMTAVEFVAYAKEQIASAKAEDAEGKADLAKARLEALKVEVEAVAKFEYKAGELPSVKIYRVPEQRTTTEQTVQPAHQQAGGAGMGFTAKAESLSALVKEIATTLTDPKPAAAASAQSPKTEADAGDDGWPSDLAKSADGNTDELHFGSDKK